MDLGGSVGEGGSVESGETGAAPYKLDQFFNITPDLLCIADRDGRLIELNSAWEGALGHRLEDMRGRKFTDFVHPDDRAATAERLARISREDRDNYVNRFRHADGSYRWLEWHSSLEGDLVYGAARDVTERKAAEQALRESEERFAEFMDRVPALCFVKDAASRLVYLNRQFRETHDAQGWIGKTDAEIWSPQEAARLSEIDYLVLELGEQVRVEEDFPVGHVIRSFLTAKFPMRGSDGGRLVGAVAMDITDQKKLEQALRESEARWRQLFESSPDGLVLLDDKEPEPVIVDCNAAFCRNSGYSREELLGLHGASIVDLLGIQVPGVDTSDAVTASITAPDISLQKADGSKAWLQPVCTRVPTADGTVLIQVLLRDVSERRGFQDYAHEIVRAQEEERQRIAHELHDVSLQAAILICRQLDIVSDAARKGDSEALAATLADARRGAEALGDEFRHFSRDLRPLILEDLGLVPALRQLVMEMEARTAISCHLAVEGKGRRLDAGVELALFRVAQEALRNAERHSGASQVNVLVAHRRNRTILTVSDDGKGFEVPDLTALVGGKHLGLVGIRERARLVGAVCEICSAPGRGTRIEVSVPNPTRQ